MRRTLIAIAGILLFNYAAAQDPAGTGFSGMMTLSNTTTARSSSFNRTGGNNDFVSIPPGETIELANINGAGIVRASIRFSTSRGNWMNTTTWSWWAAA